MTTYGDMATRIGDELARSDLTSQIQGAIMRAIRNYERLRWWFNEIMFTFPSVQGQEYFSDVDAGNRTISRLKSVDTAMLIVGNNRYPMTQRPWSYIQAVSVTTTTFGQPEDFCLYGQQGYQGFSPILAVNSGQLFRVYPICDQATYTFQISGIITLLDNEGLGPYSFPTGTTTDVWSLDCEDLICYAAKRDICGNYLKDTDAAQIAAANEVAALRELTRINTMRQSTGRVMPNPF